MEYHAPALKDIMKVIQISAVSVISNVSLAVFYYLSNGICLPCNPLCLECLDSSAMCSLCRYIKIGNNCVSCEFNN